MGNRPEPAGHANGVDLSAVLALNGRKRQLAELAETWESKVPEAMAAGVAPAIIILTARFEVLVGVLADALGIEAGEAMLQIETAALSRGIVQIDAAVADVNLRRASAAFDQAAAPDGEET